MAAARSKGKKPKPGSKPAVAPAASEPTLGVLLDHVLPGGTVAAEAWPPDVFALAGVLLQKSDAYTRVATDWPPGTAASPAGWVRDVKRTGATWRRACNTNRPSPPKRVQHLLRVVDEHRSFLVVDLWRHAGLVEALLELVAIADEASAGFGVNDPTKFGDADRAVKRAFQLLDRDVASLGYTVNPKAAVVLPKMHTPQVGMTLRSLTHHLALYPACEVTPRWMWLTRGESRKNDRRLRLLLLPWPKHLTPSDFSEVRGTLKNIPGHYGFFSYDAANRRPRHRDIMRVFGAAREQVGQIDSIVFPEMCLQRGMAEKIAHETNAVVIAGIADGGRQRPGTNASVVAVPFAKRGVALLQQDKHHRWCLDQSQIQQYGLSGVLDPTKRFWENTSFGDRELAFWTYDSWLTQCVLICEDLARQDPVAELIRAVGPTLVVALLFDGPQLAQRWPGRYATVLAEDPGSAVLTLTCAGMVRLSRMPNLPESRIVALFRDATSPAPREISLEPGVDGVVLMLRGESVEEWSADGRGDGKTTTRLVWDGVHDVRA